MKKNILSLIFLILFSSFSSAQQDTDSEERYVMVCMDRLTGGVEIAEDGKSLVYNDSISLDNNKAFWIVNRDEFNRYIIKNYATQQYITCDPEKKAEGYLTLTDEIKGNYSSFFRGQRMNDGKNDFIALYALINNLSNPFFDLIINDDNELIFLNVDYYFHGTYFAFLNEKYIKKGWEVQLDKYFDFFTLDDKELIKDNHDLMYYFPVELDLMGTDIIKKISYKTLEDDVAVKIDGIEIVNGEDFVFSEVTANKVYKIQIYKGEDLLREEDLIFTGLPVVQLYSEGKELSGNFSRGKFKLNDGGNDGELLCADIRYRGASTLYASKNSFAIKLKDEAGASIDRSYFGLRNDNYWILDAMTIDPSRMRDRISTDLWNDFSSDPYYKSEEPELVNATRGRYVEVFVDDQYWGLYCMTERVDRKQLKLKKYQEETQTIRGVLYKSDRWSYETMMGYVPDRGPELGRPLASFNNNSISWAAYEVKYPDLEDGEKIDWQPLSDVVKFCSASDEETFSREVKNYFDLPVWTDYYLFLELILATDNHGKNAYFYMHNIQKEKKLGIAPWDLDGVLGIQWGGRQIASNQDYTQYIVKVEHGEHNLFRRLKENNVAGFNDTLKARYDRLRQTWFSEESLLNRVDTYWELFQKSGADKREKGRWDIDLNGSVDYLKEWISGRVEYLNNQYGPVVEPVGIAPVTENKLFVYPNPVVEILYVRNVTLNTPVWIYTETGACIYQDVTTSHSFSMDFSHYVPGRYYVKVGDKGKVIIKK